MASSDEEPPEYEVESVLEARAEVQRRPKKLVWKFRVRWKGYTPDDDTWEPIESFNGSEHIIATFWERTNTNGRDVNDLTLFQAEETFLPLGPPRHKLKRKSSHKTLTMPPSEDVQPIKSKSTTPPSSKYYEKRRHTEFEPSGGGSDRPSKRARADNSRFTQSSPLVPERSRDIRERKRTRQIISSPTPSPNKKNSRRIDSEEVIPDSDEESKGLATTNLIDLTIIEEANQASGSAALSTSLQASEHEETDFHPLFDEPIEKEPTLRERLIEPRVKMIDDPLLSNMEGAIPAKANAVARMNADPSSSKSNVPTSDSQKNDRRRSKPGPGRSSMGLKVRNVSSLLTFSKGSLKTVKGKYVKEASRAHTDLTFRDDPPDIMEVDAISENPPPPAPPTAEELLRLAGFDNEIAGDLPDYEDNPLQNMQPNLSEVAETVAPEHVAPESVVPDVVAPTTATENENDNESSLPRESVEVAKEKLFSTNVFGTLANTWKRHTIFGPLGLGSELPATPEQLRKSQLYLNLDSSVSIPLALLQSSNSLNVQIGSKGPSGKFYHMQAALALLGTLRASGTSAIVVVDEDGSSEDRDHFLRFSARLERGDIFVAIAGVQILVFCSTTAALVSQRLNAPTAFLNEPGKILVSLVSIENYTGYADAAADADVRRWSQYIAEH